MWTRPLGPPAPEDTSQASKRAFLHDDFVSRPEEMARQTALFLDPGKLGPDHLDCLIRDNCGFALEAQHAIESRDPLQGGDAGRREIASYKKVGRKQRSRTPGWARHKKRQKRRETASCKDARHSQLGVRFGVQRVPGFHDLPAW
jgi:hypothetical protein